MAKCKNNVYSYFWIVVCSFFFYGYWNPKYLILISASILINYAFARVLAKIPLTKLGKITLTAGIIFNLALIGYYKYADFFINNVNSIAGTDFVLLNILLPLGISFFTFQQIAFLVDTYKAMIKSNPFINYTIFVTFFPQLIAGPIVHHSEIMPQLEKSKVITYDNFAIGTAIFAIGLFKKVVLADYCAEIANPIYNGVSDGLNITSFEAWDACISYTLQIYFDFSGYCDMAIGIARMLDIDLPLNFNSPYKSASITEFWRKWHITLSRFLRDYLYIPLGGNRKGHFRRYVNLIMTMLIGGLWHGAAWTFVAWGGMHGLALALNHMWVKIIDVLGFSALRQNIIYRVFCIAITFTLVAIAWVFFRAENFSTASEIIAKMFEFDFADLPTRYFDSHKYLVFGIDIGVYFHRALMFVLLLICWFAPNASQIQAKISARKGYFALSTIFGVSIFFILFTSLILMGRDGTSDFIYFNF